MEKKKTEFFSHLLRKKNCLAYFNMVPKSSKEGSLIVCAHFCALKRKLINIFMGRLVHILKCFHTFFIWQIQETPCIGYLLGSSISEKTKIWCIEQELILCSKIWGVLEDQDFWIAFLLKFTTMLGTVFLIILQFPAEPQTHSTMLPKVEKQNFLEGTFWSSF